MSASAMPSSTATPEAPSLAPAIGFFWSSGLTDLSAIGRVSQCVRYRMRSWADGLNRIITLWSESFSPFDVTCTQSWVKTESAFTLRQRIEPGRHLLVPRCARHPRPERDLRLHVAHGRGTVELAGRRGTRRVTGRQQRQQDERPGQAVPHQR